MLNKDSVTETLKGQTEVEVLFTWSPRRIC